MTNTNKWNLVSISLMAVKISETWYHTQGHTTSATLNFWAFVVFSRTAKSASVIWIQRLRHMNSDWLQSDFVWYSWILLHYSLMCTAPSDKMVATHVCPPVSRWVIAQETTKKQNSKLEHRKTVFWMNRAVENVGIDYRAVKSEIENP